RVTRQGHPRGAPDRAGWVRAAGKAAITESHRSSGTGRPYRFGADVSADCQAGIKTACCLFGPALAANRPRRFDAGSLAGGGCCGLACTRSCTLGVVAVPAVMSFREFRAGLAGALDQVRRSPGSAVFVGSHRRAEAVLVSVEQYEALLEASERQRAVASALAS